VLEEVIHDTVWEYLRVRIADIIPEIDPNIPNDTPDQIDEYRVGVILGKGTFGRVHKLHWHNGQPTGTVVKMMLKKPLSDMQSLCSMKEQIRVMQILTDEWPHPNITKLYNIYHSETHLHFQIEDGGANDLYKYFIYQDRRHVPVTEKVTQTIVQCLISAICHMHLNAHVVHCDLKPENIIIAETGDDVIVKISDFDTAKLEPKVPCHGLVGSFPFSAPEIMLDESYNPYAVDIWSLGIVIMEVLCFMHVLEETLQLTTVKNIRNRRERHHIRKRMTAKIRHYFSHPEAVDCLLDEEMRPELSNKFATPHFLSLLQGMLHVVDTERLKADALEVLSRNLF
jgi:serine/threonine protein kinase